MDRFHIEINCESSYLSSEGGIRDTEIKRCLKEVISNLIELRYNSRNMILRDTNGIKIGYARYERIGY